MNTATNPSIREHAAIARNLYGDRLPESVRELLETLADAEQRIRVLTADGHPTTEYPDDPENFATPDARAKFVEHLDWEYPHNAPHRLQHAYLTRWEDWT